MKRHPVVLPLRLPRLSDKTAAQLVELLHELIEGIEDHYAQQVHRYHLRQRQIQYDRQSPSSTLTDVPF